MESVYFWIFTALCVGAIGYGLAKPERFFEYPYFMATVFAVFILPQAVSLIRFPGVAHAEAVQSVLLMTCLCLIACFLGYLIPPSAWIAKHAATPVNPSKLYLAGLVFIGIGHFFSFLFSRTELQMAERAGLTGTGTILLFFAQLIYPGLSIAMATALRRGGWGPWLATAVAAWVPIKSVVFAGRRESAALLILSVALTLFYIRRWIPPRLAVAGAIVFALLAIPATGSYRTAMSEQNLEAVKQIDLVGNFQKFFNEESILELRNAAMIIDSVAYLGEYEFGAAYWDQMVFRFVPAQVLGKEFKEGLMINPNDGRIDEQFESKGFEISAGSTLTGMGDSFEQFGYFGCLFFLVLAVVFRTLWLTSLQPAAFFAQLLYIQTSTSAMRTVTHQTVDYLPGLAYNVIFLTLAVWYAREKEAGSRDQRAWSQKPEA